MDFTNFTLINTSDRWKELRTPVPVKYETELEKSLTLNPEFHQALSDYFKDFLNKHENAIGVAAPQFGITERAFAMFNGKRGGEYIFFIEPEIKRYEGSVEEGSEGCMSFPGMKARRVPRNTKILIDYWTINKLGKFMHQVAWFKGFAARVIQHEYDHLFGVEMWDRAIAFPMLEEVGHGIQLIYKSRELNDFYIDKPGDKQWMYSGEKVEITPDLIVKRECIGYVNLEEIKEEPAGPRRGAMMNQVEVPPNPIETDLKYIEATLQHGLGISDKELNMYKSASVQLKMLDERSKEGLV